MRPLSRPTRRRTVPNETEGLRQDHARPDHHRQQPTLAGLAVTALLPLTFLAGVTAALWLYETVAATSTTTKVALAGALLVTLALLAGPPRPSAVSRLLDRLPARLPGRLPDRHADGRPDRHADGRPDRHADGRPDRNSDRDPDRDPDPEPSTATGP